MISRGDAEEPHIRVGGQLAAEVPARIRREIEEKRAAAVEEATPLNQLLHALERIEQESADVGSSDPVAILSVVHDIARSVTGNLAKGEGQGEDSGKRLGGDGHRVVIEFDGGMPGLKLLHPEGGCTAPGQCGLCAADLADPDAKRCYDCKGLKAEGCWLDSWFENLDADELLHGTVTLPIEARWDIDHPKITVVQPAISPQPAVPSHLSEEGQPFSRDEKALLVARLARGKSCLGWRVAEEEPAVEKLMQFLDAASLSASSDTGGAGAGADVEALRDALEDGIRRAYCAPIRPPIEGENPETVRSMAAAALVSDPDRMRHLAAIQKAAWDTVSDRVEPTTSPQQSVPDSGETSCGCNAPVLDNGCCDGCGRQVVSAGEVLGREETRAIVREAVRNWSDQPECDKLASHEEEEVTDAVMTALEAGS